MERARLKLSREELAKYIEVPTPTVKGWENEGRIPGADVAVKLAAFLGQSVEWLFTGRESGRERLTRSQKRWLNVIDGMPDRDIEELLRHLDSWLKAAMQLQRLQ